MKKEQNLQRFELLPNLNVWGERKLITIGSIKNVEAGDIALYSIIPEAIAIFGYTKVGKTSSCHIMCGSHLRA